MMWHVSSPILVSHGVFEGFLLLGLLLFLFDQFFVDTGLLLEFFSFFLGFGLGCLVEVHVGHGLLSGALSGAFISCLLGFGSFNIESCELVLGLDLIANNLFLDSLLFLNGLLLHWSHNFLIDGFNLGRDLVLDSCNLLILLLEGGLCCFELLCSKFFGFSLFDLLNFLLLSGVLINLLLGLFESDLKLLLVIYFSFLLNFLGEGFNLFDMVSLGGLSSFLFDEIVEFGCLLLISLLWLVLGFKLFLFDIFSGLSLIYCAHNSFHSDILDWCVKGLFILGFSCSLTLLLGSFSFLGGLGKVCVFNLLLFC